jgi:hypothetical protein
MTVYQLDTGIGTLPAPRAHAFTVAPGHGPVPDTGVGSSVTARADSFNADIDPNRYVVAWNEGGGTQQGYGVPVTPTGFAAFDATQTAEALTVSPPA